MGELEDLLANNAAALHELHDERRKNSKVQFRISNS